MKKRTVSILLAASMLAGLIGCSGGKGADAPSPAESVPASTTETTEAEVTAAAKEPITLKLWAGIQPEYGYDEMVKKFNEEFADQGLTLEYVRYVNDDDGNLQLDTYLLGGDDVDVFIGYGGMSRLSKRVDAGLLLDMTPYLEGLGFEPEKELGENNVKGYVIDDKYYSLPTKYENANWMVANADLFREAGMELPVNGWTYQEFLKAAETLTKGEGPDKTYGMFWWLDGGFNSFAGNMGAVLGKYQTYADDDCTKTSFDNPVFAKELELAATVMENGWSPTYAEEKSDKLSFANVFLEGKAAMSFGVSQLRIVKDLETYPHDFATALIPFPVPDETYMDQASYSGVQGAGDLICVNAKTKYPEEAMNFVKWYIEGGMAPLARGGRIPLWKDFDSNEIVKALNEIPGVFDETSLNAYLAIDAANAYSTLNTDHDAEIADIKKQGYQAALLGEKTPEQAMADIKKSSDALLAE